VPGQNGASSTVSAWKGDHDLGCSPPTILRDVAVSGSKDAFDFAQTFWWCAPGNDPTKGHVMTGLDTTGYNIVWFAPKDYFSNVSKVCWDINETRMSRRKWTQVVFVSQADAIRFPSGGPTLPGLNENVARGTGGFDLGYVNPDFRENNGVTDGIISQGDTAGFRDLDGSANWFQGDHWTAQFVGPSNDTDREQTTDKATRYKHCLENGPNNSVIYTKDTPVGSFVRTLANSHIPQGVIKVVFEDDEYDGRKDDRFDPNVLTWHWDNIQVFSPASPPPPTSTTSGPTTTVQPTTTTAAPTTTAPTTTQPSTTTSTTQPTTTSSTTTTTTTTVPGSTTTTIVPIPACPAGFTTAQRNWCLAVNAHIAALEAKVH
jgi:hypothetical protein